MPDDDAARLLYGAQIAGGQGEVEQQWKLSELEYALQKETDILCRMRESRRYAWC